LVRRRAKTHETQPCIDALGQAMLTGVGRRDEMWVIAKNRGLVE
jgi:hypothetical protein